MFSAQFSGLGDADAILIAATLRSCGATAIDDNYVSTAQFVPPNKDSSRLCSGSSTYASILKAAGSSPSVLPKDMACFLMLMGFDAAELHSVKYSTAELVDVGYPASDIMAALGGKSAAVLKELSEHGLALELAAGSERVPVEELREAKCAGIPREDTLKEVVEKVSAIGTMKNLEGAEVLMGSREMLDDRNGEALIWTAALNCKKALTEINMMRNALRGKTATAIAQFLRFNRSVTLVDLHDNEIDDEAIQPIAKSLSFNSVLAHLRLSENKVTVNVTTTLYDAVMTNFTLESLVLETSGGMQTQGVPIPALKGLKANELIDLSGRRFGPVSVAVITKLIQSCRPRLIELGLDRNPLKGEGAAFVAEMLKSNDDIKEIDLRFCAIGPQGANALAKALEVNTSVERALLLANSISQEGAAAILAMLPHNNSLKYIGLQDNLLNDATKAALTAAASTRPGLTIQV